MNIPRRFASVIFLLLLFVPVVLAQVTSQGPTYFEALECNSCDRLYTTLTIDYTLSPSFISGGKVRAFLGYVWEGGALFHNGNLQWQPLNIAQPSDPNYVRVTSSSPNATFTLTQPSLNYPYIGFFIENIQDMQPGDIFSIVLGDTSQGSLGYGLSFYESAVRVLVEEDPAANGQWKIMYDKNLFPTLAVGGVRADRFVVTAPSTVSPGDTFDVTVKPVQFADSFYQSSPIVLNYTGTIAFRSSKPGTTLPSPYTFTIQNQGFVKLPVTLPNRPGIYEITVYNQNNQSIFGTSNPVYAKSQAAAQKSKGFDLYWGALQTHTALGGHALETPTFAYEYARDYADLDFFSVSEHCRDNLAYMQYNWTLLKDFGQRYSVPQEFVAFGGYEWTNAIQGHRHVIFKHPEQHPTLPCDGSSESGFNSVISDIDLLIQNLSSSEAIAIPHHSAWNIGPGGFTPFNWGANKNTPVQPLVEMYAWHGSSEYYGNPLGIYNDPKEQRPPGQGQGAYVQEILNKGYRFGFTADSDNHKGRAGSNNGGTIGLANTSSPGFYARMGISGVFARNLTHDGIWDAFLNRRTYGTTGARIFGLFTVNEHFVGEEFTDSHVPTIDASLYGTDKFAEVFVFRNGDELVYYDTPGKRSVDFTFVDTTAVPGQVYSYYVKGIQEDGHHIWISPVWMNYTL